MRVVMVVVVVHPAPASSAATATAAATAGHGHAALLTDLRVLCFHAGGDFRPIRDELGTKPHRVRRTSLFSVDGGRARGALGPGLLKATKEQRADRQCQPASEKRGPHLSYPGLEKSSHSGSENSGRNSRRRWSLRRNSGYRPGLCLPVNGRPRQNPGRYAGGFRRCHWRNA
jgi:hypothetical protein